MCFGTGIGTGAMPSGFPVYPGTKSKPGNVDFNTMIEKKRFSPVIRGLVTITALAAIGTSAAWGAEGPVSTADPKDSSAQPAYLTVTKLNDLCVVKRHKARGVLFSNRDPAQAIVWALNHSRIAVLTGGQFSVTDGLKIPRSGVTLIIARDATLQPAKGANLTAVSEGHGKYRPLIHNEGMDNVAVVNFGTLRVVGGGACIMFNGRSKGKLGINGGLIFSTGTLTQCGDAIWVVDSRNVHIPFAGAKSYGNNLMAIEGCEDLKIDVVAGLAGSKAGENETIDLNSYSRRISIGRMIGTSRSEQVLDVNNSTDILVDEIVGYTGGDRFQGHLADIINYGPNGRRLTQRPRIPKSKNVKIRTKRVAQTKIGAWKIVSELEGFPQSLPKMRVTVRLIGNPETKPVTVLERTYKLHLGEKPTSAVVKPASLEQVSGAFGDRGGNCQAASGTTWEDSRSSVRRLRLGSRE